jgi:hypothetical protein
VICKEERRLGHNPLIVDQKENVECRPDPFSLPEFFDMPPDYSATDIQKIVPAIRGEKPRFEKVYRERPFFTCYIDGL